MPLGRQCIHCHEELAWDAIQCPNCGQRAIDPGKIAAQKVDRRNQLRFIVALLAGIALIVYLANNFLP